MDGGITFTGGQLAALLAAIFTTTSGLVTFLYRQAQSAKDAQIADLKQRNAEDRESHRRELEQARQEIDSWQQYAVTGQLTASRLASKELERRR